ncbi:MAG: mechanosensitive ion channel [Gammaproteobacteria bacterium]|nr:mechanosensitive ion channel [Gammaproteobacteria bacterium]
MLSRITLPLVILLTLGALLAPPAAQAASEEVKDLEQLLTAITQEKQVIADLDKRLDGAEGFLEKALRSRLIKARVALLEQNLEYASAVADAEEAGNKNDEHHKRAIEILDSQLKAIKTTAAIIRERIVPPDAELAASQRAAAYSKIFQLIDILNHGYEIYIDSIKLAQRFDMDVSTEMDRLKMDLRERAENGSVLLEMTMDDVIALRASVAAVPDDAESKAKLNVVVAHISSLAAGIEVVLTMMESLEMDTTHYQNQLLGATGQITTDIFQVGVFSNLLFGWGETLWTKMIEGGPGLVFNIILFIIIVFVFLKLANLAQALTERGLEESKFELSQLLKRMTVSIVRNTVLIIGVLIALSQVGISLGPLLAGMGVVGFVVGFALQDTLSNFAAGMLILIYRPFDVDDIIEAGGVMGTVSEMSLVNTTILTFDNQTIIVPNGKIWGDIIKNVTAQTVRRVDLVFGIGYSDDIEKAEKVLAEVVSAHPSVLDEPRTMIKLHELGDSSVNFIVRPWVNKDDTGIPTGT